MKTYRIRNDYIHKSGISASAVHQGYWNSERVYASRFHQYQVYRLAQRVADLRGAPSVLDVGCGPGTKLAMMHARNPERAYTGVDLAEAIEYCKRTYSFGRWYVDDFDSPQTAPEEVRAALVICSDVIEHVLDPDQLLNYIRERVARDGRVVLSTPERDVLHGPGNLQATNAHHVREWTCSELAEYVRDLGFEIEYHGLQYPVRFWPNRIFYREIVRRAVAGRPLKYNQVLLLRLQ